MLAPQKVLEISWGGGNGRLHCELIDNLNRDWTILIRDDTICGTKNGPIFN